MARRAARRHRAGFRGRAASEMTARQQWTGLREKTSIQTDRGQYAIMAIDLAAFARVERRQIFHDFLHRPVWRPARQAGAGGSIADMQKDGAGFAGFATWLDLTPAHPDILAMPDPHRSSSCHGSRMSPGSPPICIDGRQAGRAGAAQRAEGR